VTPAEIEGRLAELGDERGVSILRQLGYEGPAYGVGVTKLKKLAKEIGRDPELSTALWRSEHYEAKLLSVFVADPKRLERKDLEVMVSEIPGVDVLWQFPRVLASKVPYADQVMTDWLRRPEEMVLASGYHLAAILGADEKTGDDAFFRDLLSRIEIEAPEAANWVREAMLYALIGVARRGPEFEARASEVWDKIRPVEIDYGETSCKPPDVEKALSGG
jgi:3-methyladenine DNA glycosylase AlkD